MNQWHLRSSIARASLLLLTVTVVQGCKEAPMHEPDGAAALEGSVTLDRGTPDGSLETNTPIEPDSGLPAQVVGTLSASGKVLTLTLDEPLEFEPGNGVTIFKNGVDITEDLDRGAGAVRVDDTHAVYTFDTVNVDEGTITLKIDNTELARQTAAIAGHHVRCAQGDSSIGTTVSALFKNTLQPAEAAHSGFLGSIKGVYRAWNPAEFQTGPWTFDFAATDLEKDLEECIQRGKTYFMSIHDRTFDTGSQPSDPPVLPSMLTSNTSDRWVAVRYDLGFGGYEIARWRKEAQAWELAFFEALRDYLDSLAVTHPSLWDHFGGLIRGETATGLSATLQKTYNYSAASYIDRLVETQAHLVRLFRNRAFIWQEFNFLPNATPTEREQYINRAIEAGVRITGPDIIPAYPGQPKAISDSLVYDTVRGARRDVAGRRRGIFANTMEHNSHIGPVPMADKLAFALTPIDKTYAYGGTSLHGLELDAVFWWATARWNPPDFTFFKYANGQVGAQDVQAIMATPKTQPSHDQILWRYQATLAPLPDQTITLVNP
jgi:hypothetical protein